MRAMRSALAFALLGIAGLYAPARAEVSAQLDATGNYVRTVVFTNASVHNLRIWTVTRAKVSYVPLNPTGDVSGDLWPYIVDSPTAQRWPWAVWSHFNGGDYDLVFSRWNGTSWQPTSGVEDAAGADDALSPRLAYDPSARPHLVWLSASADGHATVMLSVYLATCWMAPFPVSSPDEAPSNPEITVLPDGTIQISYDTVWGRVTKEVQFARPYTITDDITPFNAIWVTNMSSTPF